MLLLLQVRAAMVAAFGADATAKLGPLIAKWDQAVSAAGGVEALANKVWHMRHLCCLHAHDVQSSYSARP